MSNLPKFLTTSRAAATVVGTPPEPPGEGDLYLVSLLESQRALRIALDALGARAGLTDSTETKYIHVEQGMIQADQQKLNAMVSAYLATQTVYKAVTAADLSSIRAIIDDLAGFSAQRDKATRIVEAVTRLLQKWE